MKSKSAQIQVTFNWIYIMIAGAMILLFFIGIIVKEKAASEERLSAEVVDIMESIFTGASLSEKTKNFIDTSGLVDYTLYFDCDAGVSEFGLSGYSYYVSDSVNPLFAPLELSSTRLVLWSLPYRLPFKVIDFLFVTSANTKYFLVGNDVSFINEFNNATETDNSMLKINWEQLFDLNDLDPGGNFQVRIVDLDGTNVDVGKPLPEKLLAMGDKKVTAVSFGKLGVNTVDYYQKEGSVWKKLNDNPIRILSIDEERDAAKYGAIFSGSPESYQCNMMKAFKKLDKLIAVYGGEKMSENIGGKLAEIVEFYESNPETSLTTECLGYLTTYDENVYTSLRSMQNQIKTCLVFQGEQGKCFDLITHADTLRKANRILSETGDCISLY
jgi:hypothetical protein